MIEVISILLCILIAIISSSLYFFKRNLNYWKELGIPHEQAHLVMGNFKGIRITRQFGEIVADYYRKFKGTGPFAGIHIVQRPAVVLLDKLLIKDVLTKDFNNFPARGLYYNDKNDPLTGHLFMLTGTKWKNLRHKLTPTFTSSKLKLMYPTLLQKADQLKQFVRHKIQLDSIVNVQDVLNRFTIDIVGSCFLGIECSSLTNPDSEFPKMAEKSLVQPRHNSYVMAFIDSFPQTARFLGLRVLPDEVHKFFTRIITDTIAYREEHEIQRSDFLNILLELKVKENLNIEEICAQAFLFFMEGFETSAAIVNYALYELAENPEFQESLRQDIEQAIENSADGTITYQVLNCMTYIDQVISETLRKYPVMPLINRQALNDYIIPGYPQYVIKKGMRVLISSLGLHHDPNFYPDPEKFDPERFPPQETEHRHSMEYLPFGDGPRRCIGERFGQMQSRLGLAYLIKHFRFTTC